MLNKIDELKMYFGEDYRINDRIVIRQPTIGEIVEFGEQRYYSMLHTLCAIPSDLKSQLFDMKIDYEELTDFELFIMLSKSLKPEETSILFYDIDFTSLELASDTESGEIVLANFEDDLVIDRLIYQRIVDFVRQMNGLSVKIEHAANEFTKKILIEEDRDNIAMSKNKNYSSALKPLISAMCNSAGFKYKKNELKEVGIVEFMDSIQRISIIKSSDALLSGCYGGMIDTSKINKKDLNWIRAL